MAAWKLHEAKARFSEVVDKAATEGPQFVTRRGEEAAVVVGIDEWRLLRSTAKPSVKEFLLGPGPRFDIKIPRLRFRQRPPVTFDD